MSSILNKLFLIIILLFLVKTFFFVFNKKIINTKINKKKKKKFLVSHKELKDIQKFVNNIFDGILIDKKRIFYKKKKIPKISVILTIYNGEYFLKTALLSVQNQDFKDIEILMVDDASKDNSVNLIKELMVKDKRIVLIENSKNRGMLYSKIKGILMAKGKYILLLDEDDIYCQRKAFSILYNEAEKNDLDILKYRKINSKPKVRKRIKQINESSSIIYQPELSEILFKHNPTGEVTITSGFLSDLFIKRNILLKVIKSIDEKYLNEKMNFHDDTLIFFLLTRNAYNYKKINRIFYIVLKGWNETNKNVEFRIQNKIENIKYIRCNSYLNFIEFLLYKTKDNFYDKKIAFFSFNKYFLNDWCRNFRPTFPKAANISNEFLRCKYFDKSDKKKIEIFLKEISITE